MMFKTCGIKTFKFRLREKFIRIENGKGKSAHCSVHARQQSGVPARITGLYWCTSFKLSYMDL